MTESGLRAELVLAPDGAQSLGQQRLPTVGEHTSSQITLTVRLLPDGSQHPLADQQTVEELEVVLGRWPIGKWYESPAWP